MPEIITRLARRLRQFGLDIAHPFTAVGLETFTFETFGRDRALAVLVANTKAIWPHVVSRAAQPGRGSAADHPVDTLVTSAVRAALAEEALEHRVWWAHELLEPLPIQRIAMEAGLAHLAPCHLSIHPLHGPWIALRAVIVLDTDGPTEGSPAPDPCTTCDKPCTEALEGALSAGRLEEQWRDWLAIRDACPIGRSSRYGEHQLRYHYAKDPTALKLDENS